MVLDKLFGGMCCSARDKKAKTVRLHLPTAKTEPYERFHDEEEPPRPSLSRGAKCCLIVAVGWLVLVLGALGLVLLGSLKPELVDTIMHTSVEYEGRAARYLLTPLSSERCDEGLFIPGPVQTRLNVLIFFVLLMWAFVGVSVASDVFMFAIETITSKWTTKTVIIDGVEKTFTVTVWNSTVANLTLMALGSSAPEILLSMIEIGGDKFYAGELGPSTIVGSAAYNLMIISAICILAIPDGQGRYIKDTTVFFITATFSVLAYVWLIFILQVSSPNIVDVWEGVATLLFFPLLVALAYGADADWPCFKRLHTLTKQSVVMFNSNGKPISKADIAKVAQTLGEGIHHVEQDHASAALQAALQPRSRAFYRMQAGRKNTGHEMKASDVESEVLNKSSEIFTATHPAKTVIEFVQSTIKVQESSGSVVLPVRRSSVASWSSVYFKTVSGTATAGEDFVATEGRIRWAIGQRLAYITVKVIDDDVVEDDEIFQVVLSDPSPGAVLGAAFVCDVTIENDDGPGELLFEVPKISVKESAGQVTVKVKRQKGSDGKVSCKWTTKDGSAVAPSDYTANYGTLEFNPGEVEKSITVSIMDDGRYEGDEYFYIWLNGITGGAKFAPEGDGDAESQVCTVTIKSDEARKALVDQVAKRLELNADNIALAAGTWSRQFSEAFEVDSCDGGTLFVYVLALPWKLIFALVPPARLAGGWLCFFVCLAGIGLLTALIGDLANHMGCCMGIVPSITAITFVALGTSLPDTFASKTAAQREAYADNSIGNITGSNSVNVFLGLGLPWATAAIYWGSSYGAKHESEWRARYRNEEWYTEDMPLGFAVPAGDLAYSVSVFSTCALLTISTLLLRRAVLGVELGGPVMIKWISALFLTALWVVYIVASIGQTYHWF